MRSKISLKEIDTDKKNPWKSELKVEQNDIFHPFFLFSSTESNSLSLCSAYYLASYFFYSQFTLNDRYPSLKFGRASQLLILLFVMDSLSLSYIYFDPAQLTLSQQQREPYDQTIW